MFGALSARRRGNCGPSAYFAIQVLGEVCDHFLFPRPNFLIKEQK